MLFAQIKTIKGTILPRDQVACRKAKHRFGFNDQLVLTEAGSTLLNSKPSTAERILVRRLIICKHNGTPHFCEFRLEEFRTFDHVRRGVVRFELVSTHSSSCVPHQSLLQRLVSDTPMELDTQTTYVRPDHMKVRYRALESATPMYSVSPRCTRVCVIHAIIWPLNQVQCNCWQHVGVLVQLAQALSQRANTPGEVTKQLQKNHDVPKGRLPSEAAIAAAAKYQRSRMREGVPAGHAPGVMNGLRKIALHSLDHAVTANDLRQCAVVLYKPVAPGWLFFLHTRTCIVRNFWSTTLHICFIVVCLFVCMRREFDDNET